MNAISNHIIRAFALVVTDRRWTAPLSASALGFGLFVGVAIGPNATGTLAGPAPIVEMAESGGGGSSEPALETGGSSGGGLGESLAGGGGGGLLESPLATEPLATEPLAPPAEEEPATEPAPPASEAPAEEEGGEEETELKGVVVHANAAAGSYALAIEGGELVPVHARRLSPPGTKLSVVARRLANGTFAEAEPPKRSGSAGQATFRGAVTFVDPDPAAPAYTVSGRGASLFVHAQSDPSGAPPQLPALGAYVTVTAGIEKPQPAPEPAPVEASPPPTEAPPPEPTCARDPSQPPLPPADPPTVLRQLRIELEPGEPATYLDLAGLVSAVCPETGQLLLSADGIGESESDVLLAVPPQIDTSKLKLGDSYLATATVGEGGSLTLAGLAGDERTRGADDSATAQGDLKR